MAKPIITFKNVNFKYYSQSEPTLHNININIYPGEKVLIVGASGSGKSTFVNCINGLIPFKYEGDLTGQIIINGEDAKEGTFHERSNIVGTVLQDTDGQFIGLTAAEDMAFMLENNNVNKETMHKDVHHWSKVVNIDEHLNKRPQDLSGGQKQRVSLGGVLIHQPPILVLDEPLANLDPHSGYQTMKLLEELHQYTDSTMIMVEHRLEEALDDTFDRVILFKDGKIYADLMPDEILRSNYLNECGIREPLYASAVKYTQTPIQEKINFANVNEVSTNNEIKQAINNWQLEQIAPQNQYDQYEPLLTLEDINYQYNRTSGKILNHINLNIYPGEMLSIVGHNGAGKSTLAKAICGFIHTKGKMFWNNESFHKLSISERSEHVGYVMQNPNHMISEKMIFDEVALGLKLRNKDEAEIKTRVFNILKTCGLYPFRNWPISALSYGQKKRVTIASILVLSPEIIILDEPTAGQDYYHYTEMMTFLKSLNEDGQTIIMITHDMHLLAEYTDRTIVISDGKIIADTTPIKLLADQKLCEQSALRQTSLYKLAQRAQITSPQNFVRTFIEFDKEVKKS
ncbi:ABC transporter ATP-binding protein [Mammaliicoccus sciuri]|uniref:ABC transporter ATP-binding protein n=1 Tax=Mammaliicoccus sciuri TaxID=1296 RepID=UPI002DBF91B9|nr:ABC transporter ATP-binding protein [Mammaliicoccus sciuri]MEB7424600.1 ABC transporter ATP-binding protein [Mammaliicoccus sciuri]